MMGPERVEALVLAGRSGVGKTTVSYEVSDRLARLGVAHALIDGDNLDAVVPPTRGSALAEANLAAVWRNYAALGHRRAIYVNTVSVLEEGMIRRALGGDVAIIGVLLTAGDAEIEDRLGRREIGSALDAHLARSAAAAARLDAAAPGWVHRVATDGRAVEEVAATVVSLTGWADAAAP